MKNPRQGSLRSSRKLAFEALEPRALLSADLLPVAELPEPAAPVPAEFRDTAAFTPAVPVVQLGAESPRELVIVDAAIDGAATLADEWAARGFEVVLLDPSRDALDQIGALLGERHGLAAVHLVSHGTQGSLQLGGTTLGAAELSARAANVARWADAFAADGDLLLYACDVAGGDTGRAFVERLALLTGADVAASADATGAALLGGDWTLEHAHGAIEASSLPPAHDWIGVLATDTLDWDAVLLAGQWPDSSLGANAMTTTLGGTVTGTVTGDTAFLSDVGGGDPRITPVVSDRVDAGTGENTLQLQADGFDNVQSVTLTLDFSAFAFGVSNLSFTVFDVDSGGFIDRVIVTSDRGDPVILTPSSVNVVVGTNAIVGNNTGNSPNNSADGNAGFSFSGVAGIRTLTLNYGNDGTPTGQGIGLHDVTFDATPGASDRTVTTAEDQAYTFAVGDFGFADYGGDTLQGVRITTLPGAGSLRLNGVAVTVGQDIAAADIALGRLTFQPAAEASGAPHATFRFRVSDGTSLSVADYRMAINVTPLNDAPALDAGRTPLLAPVSEDAGPPVGAVGTLVASLVDFASPGGQVDNVTDPDAGALLGIALTGADTSQGTWFYSLNDGGNWSALPAVSASNALLLSADAGTRLYFQPDADYAGSLASAITFRAWDRTSGVAGSQVDPGAGGGTSAFSTASDTASLVVTAVNDAPVIGNLAGDARGYAAGAGAVAVDQGAAASVADGDSANFDGGSLVVGISAGEVAAEDVLAIATGPSVSLSAGMTVGSTVSVGGVAIGTITASGAGGADLAVSLNANATAARVTTLLQAVTYTNNDAASPTPGSRTLRFTLSDGDGGTSTPVDATVTVKPVVSIAGTDAAAAEPGNDGRFTVSLSAASATDTVVTFTVTGTAANGTDYTLVTSPVTILAGATTAFIDIAVIDDLVVEGAETVTVTLNAVSAGDADIRIDGTANGATVTIAASDTVTLTVADAAVNEGAGTITFAVTADRAVGGGFSVDALFGGGTATGGVDYANATQTLVFAGTAGETQFVTVAITNDLVVEANETFTVSLGNLVPVTAPPGSFTFTDTATGTITNNDAATLTVADATVNEAAGTITFSVTVDRAVQSGFSIDALFGGGTATGGTDYASATQTLVFAGTAGETQLVTVAITEDLVVEADETFTISLANLVPVSAAPGAFTFTDVATGTIVDNDAATITVGDVTVSEAAASITFSVTVDRAVQGGFSIDALFSDGTATGGVDYVNATQTLAFAGSAGETQLVTVAITNDLVVEANETFTISLGNLVPVSAPPGAFTFTDTATGTIANDDVATLSVADVPVSEAAGTMTFLVTVDRAVDGGFAVDALFGGGSAAGGTDYADATQALVFVGAAGETQLVTVAITSDLVVEANETFVLSLANLAVAIAPPGAVIVSDTATGTIVDDDTATLNVADATVNEAAGSITFSVTVDRAVQGGFSIDALFGGGTATGGTDYANATQTLAFTGTAGETQLVTVAITDDLVVEADEAFTVSFGNLVPVTAPPGSFAFSDTATGTILDDDTATITVGDVMVSEAAGTITFAVTVDRAVQAGFTIDVLFAGGTATGGTDYANATQTLVFAATAGETQFVTVAITDDLVVEANETFAVSLGNLVTATAPPASLTFTDTATGTIVDNDVATLTIGDVTAGEDAGSITFSITVDRAVQGGFSIDALFGGGSATAGIDYDAALQTVAFTGIAGEVRTVTVTVYDDPLVEADETFIATLANVAPVAAPPGSFVHADTAIGTLLNDDSAPTLLDATTVLPENSPAATLVIDLSDALTGTDADPDSDPIAYAIVAGNGAGAFTLDAATGILTVASAVPLDFETTPVFVLTVLATDGTNTDAATLTIDLSNVNEAPTVGAPAGGAVAEDQVATFSIANGNAIVLADVDAATLQVTLTATNGVLSLASVAGLAFSSGDGVADATMTFSGGIAAINGALDGLGYAPGANFNGPALVSILADDLGQSGSGGPQTAGASIAMTVTPVNDAPTIAGDLALLVLEGQAVTVLSADLLGVDVDDAGTGLVFEVIAPPGRGRVELAGAPDIAIASFTQADLDAGRVRYVHDGSETTADAFSLRLSDGGEDGAAPALGTLNVVVVPVNDAPVLATGNGSVDEGARIVLTTALVSATDPDNATATLLFSLDTVIGGYVELVSAIGVPITSFTGAQLEAGLVRFVQADAAVAPAFRVTVSDGQTADGPRVVVLTLRGAGSQPQNAPSREAAPEMLTATAFLADSRLAEVRVPQVVAFLREPRLEPTGPTVAEPEPATPAAASTRVAGAVLQTPPVELAAAGLRFAPPPPSEVAVPRIDFSFDSGRHNLEPPEGGAPLGLAAIDAVRVAGLALTAGGVWWVFRMGSLIGSALVSAPAWRHIDPLPVLGGSSRDTVEWDAPDEPAPDAEADASEQYFNNGDTANSPRG